MTFPHENLKVNYNSVDTLQRPFHFITSLHLCLDIQVSCVSSNLWPILQLTVARVRHLWNIFILAFCFVFICLGESEPSMVALCIYAT